MQSIVQSSSSSTISNALSTFAIVRDDCTAVYDNPEACKYRLLETFASKNAIANKIPVNKPANATSPDDNSVRVSMLSTRM
jgi:hypothetical protein